MMDTVNVILFFPVLSHGCEMYLTSREEQRRRFIEKRILREIFRPKREKIREMYRKLPCERLYDLYSTPCLLGFSNKEG
jgi:hypothetical protein